MPTKNTTDDAAKRQATNMEPVKADPALKHYKADWNRFIDVTVKVDLRITYWRGRRQLTLADYGLDDLPAEVAEQYKKRVSFGSQVLMNEADYSAATSGEKRARQVLTHKAVASPWGGAIVLEADYPKLREQLEELREAFLAVGENVAATVAEARERVRSESFRMAQVAWGVKHGANLASLDVFGSGVLTADEFERLALDPEFGKFASAFIARAIAKIPTAEAIRESWSFEWTPSYIEPPKMLAESLAIEELEKKRDGLKKAIASISVDTEKAKAAAELRNVRERLAIKKSIETERAAKAKSEYATKIEAAVEGLASTVCSTLADAARDLRASIAKNSYIHPKAVEGFRSSLDIVRSWNRDVLTNPEIDRLIAEGVAVANSAATADRDGAARLALTLDDVETVMRGRLVDLATDSKLALDDATDYDAFALTVKAARVRLALDDSEVATIKKSTPKPRLRLAV